MNASSKTTSNPKRIVVKVGTCVVSNADCSFDEGAMGHVIAEIARLWGEGKEVLLVTSGAVATGMYHLKLKDEPHELPLQNACAAVGQNILMERYRHLFLKHGINVAQILIDSQYFNEDGSHADLRETLERLLKARIIPIINENDALSTRGVDPRAQMGIIFDDNDMLSALVAITVKADALMLLTNVEGFYNKNPHNNGDATLFKTVEKVTPEIEAIAGDAGLKGRGGMKSKVRASKLATAEGVEVYVGTGKKPSIIQNLLERKEGTLFKASWVDV